MKGRKASLLVLEEESLEEESFLEERAPSSSPLPSATNKPQVNRSKLWFLERILSSRLVTFFTCQDIQQGYFQDAIHAGAPKAVVRTMKQFPHSARIQRMGISALKDMASDSWAAKDKVIQAMGVDAILKAMRLHPKDCGVHQVACGCFYVLTAGDAPKILMEKGVVAAILQTMIHHGDDEDVLPDACNCLLALTDENPAALDMLRNRLGGVELAKIEHKYRGKNGEISKKAGDILKRMYI
jgi:hypothetical protein